jgi:PAS domain S-box-containing protein
MPGPDDLTLYKHIVEQLTDAIIFADRNGVILLWNRGAEEVFGFPAAEVIGSSLDVIIPERFRKAHWDAFNRAIASGQTSGGNQVRTTRSIHKLGHKLYVDLSFGLVTDAAGAVVGSVAMARDCSARHEADKALRNRLADTEGKTS